MSAAGNGRAAAFNGRGRGRRTLTLLLENNVIREDEPVVYRRSLRSGGTVLAQGWISPSGIRCRHCNEIFCLSKFEAHAGSGNRRPLKSIYLQDGRSLADCLLQLENAHAAAAAPPAAAPAPPTNLVTEARANLQVEGRIPASSQSWVINRAPQVVRFIEFL